MTFLEKLFHWMVLIGLLLLFGRVLTLIFRFMNRPFPTFFKDYSIPSFIVLIVGVIGSEIIKSRNKGK
ncbi:hypothetical protein [Sporolactobacillus terrae]|uniref:hypothetical protein n=1 Tax=Sporolactobacillus terrae TaxID=269673 RepID=UPI0011184089|nr:hypothetical protein [Sporolactobacillus terrae]